MKTKKILGYIFYMNAINGNDKDKPIKKKPNNRNKTWKILLSSFKLPVP